MVHTDVITSPEKPAVVFELLRTYVGGFQRRQTQFDLELRLAFTYVNECQFCTAEAYRRDSSQHWRRGQRDL